MYWYRKQGTVIGKVVKIDVILWQSDGRLAHQTKFIGAGIYGHNRSSSVRKAKRAGPFSLYILAFNLPLSTNGFWTREKITGSCFFASLPRVHVCAQIVHVRVQDIATSTSVRTPSPSVLRHRKKKNPRAKHSPRLHMQIKYPTTQGCESGRNKLYFIFVSPKIELL